jgi:hypothetical protein
MDLGVTATVLSSAGAAFRVLVAVTGLPAGHSATLAAASDAPAAALVLDPRCEPVQLGSGTCAVAHTPATFSFLVTAPAGTPVTLTFRVTPDGQAVETHPDDNTARLVLTP